MSGSWLDHPWVIFWVIIRSSFGHHWSPHGTNIQTPPQKTTQVAKPTTPTLPKNPTREVEDPLEPPQSLGTNPKPFVRPFSLLSRPLPGGQGRPFSRPESKHRYLRSAGSAGKGGNRNFWGSGRSDFIGSGVPPRRGAFPGVSSFLRRRSGRCGLVLVPVWLWRGLGIPFEPPLDPQTPPTIPKIPNFGSQPPQNSDFDVQNPKWVPQTSTVTPKFILGFPKPTLGFKDSIVSPKPPNVIPKRRL